MSCKKHPCSGTVWMGGDISRCYDCYCEQLNSPVGNRTVTEEDKKQKEGRMDRFLECYVEGTDGGKHYHHWTLQSAQTEAERLSRVTGKVVYVFECVGKCYVEQQPVKWEVPH